MAVTYGFYDSLNHDRLYNAQQMSAIFDGIINDGVFMSVGNQFHTVAGTGMQVIVKSGRAWFDSTWTLNDAEYPLSIDAADVLLTRIDAVVLEVNSEVATRANTIKVVKGTPASTPAKPTLTNTAMVHQHALAYVTVAKNTTAITNSMIEIVVGKTETPYVTAILQTTDITDLFNQWEDYFQTWFDNVRSTLDGDVALNLQNQITSLDRKMLLPSTPPKIGLPGSATGDDMFNVLCKVADLYVWRKTIITSQEVPAAAILGPVQNKKLVIYHGSRENYYYTDNLIVADNGTVITGNFVSDTIASGTNPDALIGKYFYMTDPPYVNTADSGYVEVPANKIIYIPTDAEGFNTTTSDAMNYKYLSKYQIVTGSTPKNPAGTTITYPVSTNPNAYQEGSDAKPAGYMLGEVVTGSFSITPKNNGSQDTKWGYTASATGNITVTDDGVVSLSNFDATVTTNGGNSNAVSTFSVLKGKYATFVYSMNAGNNKADLQNMVVFFPSDAVFSQVSDRIVVDRYQPIIGYAAIPANTTIEYLGKLGNKARVQMVSYIGTGTYGKDNPCSLTFDFPPKILVRIVVGGPGYSYPNAMRYRYLGAISLDGMTAEYKNYAGLSEQDDDPYSWGKLTDLGKKISWYNTHDANRQMNGSGIAYTILALV